jgi:phenylacetic acid degradation operon negative regulatory protein
MTIYGLYAREEGGAIPVAALIRMLGDLGIEEAGVRSSVSRMKRRGTLESRRGSGVAEYALSARSLEIIIDGDARIYSRQRSNATDPWLLIVFSVPEAERGKRHTLRSQLTRMGFGAVEPGVWIAPASLFSETKNRLYRLGLAPYVDFFSVDHLTPEQLGNKISQWWDLDSLDSLYLEFVEKYEPLQDKWRLQAGRGHGSPELYEAAFSDYIYMFTAWRRMPFLDPGLPLEFLPNDWSGLVAERLFSTLHTALGPLAHEHVREIIHPR